MFLVVKGGVEANEMINEGLDSMLHEWQLKFNMIGWSGGFLQVQYLKNKKSPSFLFGWDLFGCSILES